MKTSRAAVAVCILGVLLGLAKAAGASDSESYSRVRLLTATGERIEARDAQFTVDRIVAKRSNGKPVDVPRDQIRALDVCKGTNAGRDAAIGAGIGLLTGLLAIAQVSADPNREVNKSAAVKFTAALTVGGGLIGLAVGSSSPRWESLPLSTARAADTDRVYAVRAVRVSF